MNKNNDVKQMYHMMSSKYLQLFQIEETINYIIEQIYVHKNLTPICLKLIFRRLFTKLTTKCAFKLNSRFFREVDDSTMAGPLSVFSSDIYMLKMDNDVAVPSKSIVYHRRYI